MAKDFLNANFSENLQVVGGFLSPVNDLYGKPGMVHSRHRIAMCEAAVQEDPDHWIGVDTWESEQLEAQKTVFTLRSIRDRIQAEIPAALLLSVRVMLLAGMDLIGSFVTPELWLEEQVRSDWALYLKI